MDRRVKERLVGATILVAVIVVVVPELLSGPKPAASSAPATPTASVQEPVRNVTVDLATSKPPAPEPRSPDTRAVASSPQAEPGVAPANPDTPESLETAASSPTSTATAGKSLQVPRRPWSVQLGSFASRANADKLTHEMRAQGLSVYTLPGGSAASPRYRVRMGPMADRETAARAVAQLKGLNVEARIVPSEP